MRGFSLIWPPIRCFHRIRLLQSARAWFIVCQCSGREDHTRDLGSVAPSAPLSMNKTDDSREPDAKSRDRAGLRNSKGRDEPMSLAH